jgi:error-prone DNA polymerase
MLSDMNECADLVEQHGLVIDWNTIDYTDSKVYDRICSADTVGAFQIETPLQRRYLPRLQPRSLDELTACIALHHPGPMKGGALIAYLRRKRGEPPTYDHSTLQPVLEETLGLILYQDQVTQSIMALTGVGVSEAERMRKSLSRHVSSGERERQRGEFVDACRANGVQRDAADKCSLNWWPSPNTDFPKPKPQRSRFKPIKPPGYSRITQLNFSARY